MTSQKHYEALAKALADVRPQENVIDGRDSPEFRAWAAAVEAVANVLAADNPRFIRARFYTAAGR
jgi:hypothetical protein